ncbi:MAG: hypothetical protein ACTSQH_05190 [Candidatus Hodarchaeales archaeon]
MSTEENSSEKSSKLFWKNLVIRYWVYVLIFGLIMIGAIIGFILTLDWYLNTTSIGGQGTWTFDQFSMGTMVEFVVFLFLYLLVIVGIPTTVAAGITVAILYFVVFDPELKEGIKLQLKRDEERNRRFGRSSEGGGVFGFLMFIGVCIKVTFDGNWMTEFGSLSYKYFVDAWITVFIWGLIIVGIPAVIIGIWYVRRYGK